MENPFDKIGKAIVGSMKQATDTPCPECKAKQWKHPSQGVLECGVVVKDSRSKRIL